MTTVIVPLGTLVKRPRDTNMLRAAQINAKDSHRHSLISKSLTRM